ncbi:MAG: L-seryl-tRNA(Ser) seleniumtransferase [Clostridia bacterium]|nr:L-seryl-tRNA(Ser) seleniumtransferase [Clostridia bacterium]
MKNDLRRQLPSINQLIEYPLLQGLNREDHNLVVNCARGVVNKWRQKIGNGQTDLPLISELAQEVKDKYLSTKCTNLRRVINATGTILHTNLGRAVLSKKATEAIIKVSKHYSNLEYDLLKGKRGNRYDHVTGLLQELTGCEAALVVNNNAAAVLLALSALAVGRETVISRGQLVEIGGSFRVPEVMAQSGTRLVEVGTTNKTYPRDYEAAINPETALILKVHPSNYRIQGFTQEVSTKELVEVGSRWGIPVMEDLGSGFLIDLNEYGISGEPTVQDEIKQGLDVVTFSGDKLLGGPQAGIIVGRRDLIKEMERHPLNRALRIDKMTLAALEATLQIYRNPSRAIEEIPTLKALITKKEVLYQKAKNLKELANDKLETRAKISLIEINSKVGGGALPLTLLPSWGIAIKPISMGVDELLEKLRKTNPPVLSRIREENLVIDVRTLLPGEDIELIKALVQALGE